MADTLCVFRLAMLTILYQQPAGVIRRTVLCCVCCVCMLRTYFDPGEPKPAILHPGVGFCRHVEHDLLPSHGESHPSTVTARSPPRQKVLGDFEDFESQHFLSTRSDCNCSVVYVDVINIILGSQGHISGAVD